MCSTTLRRALPSLAFVSGLVAVLLLASGRAAAQAEPGDKYALLVGVRAYESPELNPLKYPEADVTDLARELREQGYRDENIVLLTQRSAVSTPRLAPRAGNIRQQLQLLLRDRRREDTVLVAVAGHGVQLRGSSGSYFCPVDARLDDRNTLISLDEIYKELQQSPAGFKLLLADACRNDPLAHTSRSPTASLESVTRPTVAPPPGGVAAFFSCSAGEVAFEDDTLKHGVFFHFVIQGLHGEAAKGSEVTLPGLEEFVKQRVNDFVRARRGVRQMPELVSRTRGLVSLAHIERRPAPGIQQPATPTLEEQVARPNRLSDRTASRGTNVPTAEELIAAWDINSGTTWQFRTDGTV
jgi:hypothetical protein